MSDQGFVFDADDTSDTKLEAWNSRELNVFAIDGTRSMFDNTERGEQYISLTLKGCKSEIMKKIVGSSPDLIGIVIYGTRDSDCESIKHVATLTEPKIPDADIVMCLEQLIDGVSSNRYPYGHSDDYSLADVLWYCTILINKCRAKVHRRRITIVTVTDCPHSDNAQKQHQTRKKANDLRNLGIELELVTLRNDFDTLHFYKEILQIVNNDDDDGTSTIDDMLEGRYRKDYKKRSVCKLRFHLGHNVCLGVRMYNFYRPLRVPAIVKLDRRTNETVKIVRKKWDEETGVPLLRSDLQRCTNIGNMKLVLTEDEMTKLKVVSDVGVILLGFRDQAYLTPEMHFKPSSFLYPTDEDIKGSTLLFTALLQACIRKRKFALCYLISRFKGKPSLVALTPQEEQKDARNQQTVPPGFHIIHLPFAEKIREIVIPEPSPTKTEDVELLAKILKKMSFKYSPSTFENPHVQTHWASVTALALNHPQPAPINDLTVPELDVISERLGALEIEFRRTVFPTDYDPEEVAAAKRRYPSYQPKAAKLPKFDPEDPHFVKKMVDSGQNEKLTVAQMQKFLRDRNVSVPKLKKSDLLSYVLDILENDK